ncbi:beta-2-glycoprotein 1-like [Cyclopterus lumpus]|uniref:Beta-2-glycoprotein 1 n=1 Tax=Cyclopterus lumpus TaxID=8103 RepID=A0A8C3GCV6_CYCLU|nr:beta-2-glycoprotein 1-like [Cyclopterus lumpus]
MKEQRSVCTFLQRMERMLVLILLCPFVYFTTAASKQDNVCFRPELAAHIETDGLQRFFSPGVELTLSCNQGYTPVLGPRKIVCGASGEWTKTKLLCIPKRCPYPEPLVNGESSYVDVVFQSMINFTCDEGYTLTGDSTTVCLANGTWSAPEPVCKPVSCGLAPIPEFGMIIYDKRIRGNTTDYGVGGTYNCLPPYVVVGNARAECTNSGNWTKTPECRVVTCPTPENIDKGYISSNDQREYDYMETVKYGCNGDYVIEGNFQIVCQQNGKWSEKPSCKAPCTIGIQKARILHKRQKIWIKDLQPNIILHKDIVSVYCMDKVRKCGYAVQTQCTDGRLKIPECFEQPSGIDYNLHSRSLPSEIEQC